MLQVAGLQHEFWQEAGATACYLQNRSPHKALGLNTPYCLWFGRKPHVGHLKTFGGIAYSHVPTEIRKKLDIHSIKCVFVGYGESNGVKGYRLFNPQSWKFFYCRSVIIDEDNFFRQAQVPLLMRKQSNTYENDFDKTNKHLIRLQYDHEIEQKGIRNISQTKQPSKPTEDRETAIHQQFQGLPTSNQYGGKRNTPETASGVSPQPQ